MASVVAAVAAVAAELVVAAVMVGISCRPSCPCPFSSSFFSYPYGTLPLVHPAPEPRGDECGDTPPRFHVT
jgi:hypothetical protein